MARAGRPCAGSIGVGGTALSGTSPSAILRASSATASAVSAPARRATASPATRCSWFMWRASNSTWIRALVPSLSPWAARAAVHQSSWTGVNRPAERACSRAVEPGDAPGLRTRASR